MGDLILNITALVTDVAAAKREAEAELAAAAEFEAVRDEADRNARAARTRGETILHVLAAKAALGDMNEAPSADKTHNNGAPSADKPRTAPDALTGRASVLKVINDGDDDWDWTVKSVSEALGVPPEDEGKVATSLQRLASGFKGSPPQIARPRRGVYKKLLPDTVRAAPGEDQRVSSNGGSQHGAERAASTFEFR